MMNHHLIDYGGILKQFETVIGPWIGEGYLRTQLQTVTYISNCSLSKIWICHQNDVKGSVTK